MTKQTNILLWIALLLMPLMTATAQKRAMDHADFAIWKHIRDVKVSSDGGWVVYRVVPGEGDGAIHLYNVDSGNTTSFPRADQGVFTHDDSYLVCKVSPHEDTLKSLRRANVEKEDLPGDTLYVIHLTTLDVTRIPNVRDVRTPDKWHGHIAFTIQPEPPAGSEEDTTDTGQKEKKPGRKSYSGKNGRPLLLYHLATGHADTLDYVTDFVLADAGPGVAAISKGRDSTLRAGVYAYDFDNHDWKGIKSEKGDYEKLAFNKIGTRLAFIGDTDTTKARIRPYNIYLWSADRDSANALIRTGDGFLPAEWTVSNNATLHFSEDHPRLFFGVAPPPVLPDTSLLEEEKVSVEVWHYRDTRMYTQQNVRTKDEKERSYLAYVDLDGSDPTVIATEEIPEHRMDRKRNSPFVVLYDMQPYLREMSWTGITQRDVYLYDLATKEMRLLAKGIDKTPALSPGFSYAYWYDRTDSLWHVVQTADGFEITSEGIPVMLYDELNDEPTFPREYGSPGWTRDDSLLLVYDRYDIWAIDPHHSAEPLKLTDGRPSRTKYRYIQLDREEESIDTGKPLLLYTFNEESKASGYAQLEMESGSVTQLLEKPMKLRHTPVKAKEADLLVFTEETFQKFPDLQITADWFASQKQISQANPQQSEYLWGDAELYHWKTFDGRNNTGVLVKPEGFDPSKKYPMIVNFYERSSDNLYQHRTPAPHRSTINYSFYASRGYVIFNPDVHYTIGHPGKSAYNAVVSGVKALIAAGFVDPERIGVQGHSWGGYQVAHLITKTDIFACAESGAPVVNMVSAYGGIRWQTGLSRMFQYERTQSRLGKTLWESPELYLENSPIFNLDKVTTPVLIMHNDSDGHVPWYQGIEFFVAMRRLGKPAWLLNYNDEPHWPLKLELRKDFNIRMQQFFDHYLMDAPMPVWMQRGVPAIEKGILQGRELIEE